MTVSTTLMISAVPEVGLFVDEQDRDCGESEHDGQIAREHRLLPAAVDRDARR